MQTNNKTYNRNNSRRPTINSFIKDIFRLHYTPQVITKHRYWDAYYYNCPISSTAIVSSESNADGVYLEITLSSRYVLKGNDIELWSHTYWNETPLPTLSDCYEELHKQLRDSMDSLHLQQRVVNKTLLALKEVLLE